VEKAVFLPAESSISDGIDDFATAELRLRNQPRQVIHLQLSNGYLPPILAFPDRHQTGIVVFDLSVDFQPVTIGKTLRIPVSQQRANEYTPFPGALRLSTRCSNRSLAFCLLQVAQEAPRYFFPRIAVLLGFFEESKRSLYHVEGTPGHAERREIDYFRRLLPGGRSRGIVQLLEEASKKSHLIVE
jgi:hypothetical protein